MTPPDLDNPLWQLLLIAALLWIVLALLWAHDRAKQRRALRARSGVLAHLGATFARAARAVAARLDHGVHRDRRRSARDERRAKHHRVGDAGQRPALTDDEVVALARYLDLGWGVDWSEAQVLDLAEAHVKVGSSADAILNSERVARR